MGNWTQVDNNGDVTMSTKKQEEGIMDEFVGKACNLTNCRHNNKEVCGQCQDGVRQLKPQEALTGVPQAIKVISNALKTDDGYRKGWQANIAMSIYDAINECGVQEYLRHRYLLHKACNDGAERFMQMLCQEHGES